MKKIIAILMLVTMSLSLASCGNKIDKQPAIDAYDKAYAAFNELAEVVNATPENFEDSAVNEIAAIETAFNQHKSLLEGDEKLTEEAMAEMITWYNTVENWVANSKEKLGIE